MSCWGHCLLLLGPQPFFAGAPYVLLLAPLPVFTGVPVCFCWRPCQFLLGTLSAFAGASASFYWGPCLLLLGSPSVFLLGSMLGRLVSLLGRLVWWAFGRLVGLVKGACVIPPMWWPPGPQLGQNIKCTLAQGPLLRSSGPLPTRPLLLPPPSRFTKVVAPRAQGSGKHGRCLGPFSWATFGGDIFGQAQ